MTAAQHIIYGLVDPRTKLVRYVGCSATGMRRPRAHRNPKESRYNPYKGRWLGELRAAGLDYEIAILQVSTAETLKTDEVWWIAYARASNWPLTNLTNGGDGTIGYSPTAEARAKISAYHKGREHSAEHNAKVSVAHRGKVLSAEHREKLKISHLGLRPSAETIEKRRAKMLGQKRAAPPRPGLRINLRPLFIPPQPRKPITDVTRAKLRAAKLGRALPREQVAKIAAANTGRRMTDEQRARMSAAQRAAHAHITHCPRGHEYTPENVRYKPGSSTRECRQCGRDYHARKAREQQQSLTSQSGERL